MATADPAVLDDFLNKFKTQVDAGFGLISGDVTGVLATLVVISVVATAMLWAIDENQNVMASLVRKVLLVGFFAWLVTQWQSLSATVVNGFAALGLKAGGGGMSVSTFTTEPSQIVMAGIKVIAALFQYVQKIAPGPVEFFAHIDTVLMTLVAAIGILIAFVILAVEIVVTIIEFHIVTLVAFVTVPFGVLTQTSFMSEKAIGYVVSVGVKLMALAIVVSLGTTIFNNYTVSTDPGIGEDVGLLLAAVLMVMLALKVPAIAGALISGGPQLNAGGAVMGAAGVAAGVAGGALAARALGGAVAGGWAAGGQIASARSAAGAIPSGGGGGAPSGGGTGGGGSPSGGGPGPGDYASAPVSSAARTVRMVADRMFGGGAADDEPPPSPPPAETVARAESRGPGLADVARGAAASTLQDDGGGPGMSATPRRDDSDEPRG
ncbi:MAG TPA: P-type conjugative transfer protein TrbL [Caulobacteraceae bacterium]|nr:P-type conjugative transfer protein TrbL [Caulobacteraceae bacterium]